MFVSSRIFVGTYSIHILFRKNIFFLVYTIVRDYSEDSLKFLVCQPIKSLKMLQNAVEEIMVLTGQKQL